MELINKKPVGAMILGRLTHHSAAFEYP